MAERVHWCRQEVAGDGNLVDGQDEDHCCGKLILIQTLPFRREVV